MTKLLIFDTGSLISLTSNNLLTHLDELKKRFMGQFCITKSAKMELVDRPLTIKRFSFEALQTSKSIRDGTFSIVKGNDIYELAERILHLANNLVFAHHKPIRIVSPADVEGLAAAKKLKALAYVIDERTARLLVEDIPGIQKLMERRLHTKVTLDPHNQKELEHLLKGIPIIRSFELALVIYKLGLLDHYALPGKKGRAQLLEAILWGVKTDGCSVTEKEIRLAVKSEQ